MNTRKITRFSVCEMVCSICIIVTTFLPWMDMYANIMGVTRMKSESLSDDGAPLFYVICALCIINFFTKFFNRSLLLSFITAAIPLGYVLDLSDQLNEINTQAYTETFGMAHASLGIGASMAALVCIIMLISVFIGWILNLREKATESPKEKTTTYFRNTGYGLALTLISILAMGHLPHLLHESVHSNVAKGIISIVLMVMGVLGILLFLHYLLLALMTKAHHQRENDKPNIVDSTMEVSASVQKGNNETDKTQNHKKSQRTSIYAISGIIAVAIIGIICFFTFGKGKKSESILGLQKPKWEKFVHMTGKETAFYKSPDTSSPRLMQACNADGCGGDYQYLWTGEKPSEGYTNFENYKYEDENSVFPVIEEQDGWYKVYLSTKDKIHEAYVEKSQCEEVTPETITQEALSKISSDYYLLEQGKYKNLCFALGSNDIGESELCMGELIDEKCIAFSSHYDMYILENDTTPNFTFSRREYISDDGATNYAFSIFFNPNRSISTGDYEHFNTKSLTEEEISNMVEKTTSVKHDNGLLRYAYYFPSVSGNSLFYFYPYKEFEGEENMEEVTTAKHISNYRVEDDEKLIATVDGEDREVGLDIGKTVLFGVKDLDGDGNMEAIASHYMSGINGVAVDCPFIVYYDPESDTFKKTEEMKITIDTEPTIEEEGGKPIIIQRDGLRTVRYMFENKMLKVLDDKTKKYGHIETKIDLADLFGDAEEGEKTLSVVFPNGKEATLHFEYENGGMYHGFKMTLENIELANGEEIYVGKAAKTFYILKETTNDMPEIIGDTHLYRWNGENYVEK